MTDPKRTEQIRERAHQLWEQDGSPDGRDAEHWAQAEAELEADEAADAPPLHTEEERQEIIPSSIAGIIAADKPASTPRKPSDE